MTTRKKNTTVGGEEATAKPTTKKEPVIGSKIKSKDGIEMTYLGAGLYSIDN
jgi:hypothetical protein